MAAILKLRVMVSPNVDPAEIPMLKELAHILCCDLEDRPATSGYKTGTISASDETTLHYILTYDFHTAERNVFMVTSVASDIDVLLARIGHTVH